MANTPSDLDFVTRFVCLGSEEGCYSVQEKQDFTEKTPSLNTFLSKEKGQEVIKRMKRIFQNKSYVTKDPFLYALARIIRNTPVSKDHSEDDVRSEAYALAREACESPMDLFTLVDYDKSVAGKDPKKAGWGRGMRNFVKCWYESKTPMQLASEVTKCKSGRGWTHRDLIRMSHIQPHRKTKGNEVVMKYLFSGKKELELFKECEDAEVQKVVTFLKSIESLNSSSPAEKEVVRSLVEEHGLTGRQIPSNLLNLKETYEGMLGHMTMEDLFRSIPRMALLGMLDHVAPQALQVIDRLKNSKAIEEEKVPPMVVFNAMRRYEANRAKKWIRNHHMVKALHQAFNVSFQNLPKLGKRTLLAVHIHSKITKQRVSGSSYLVPVTPCALMAQFLVQSAEHFQAVFFNDNVTELKIIPKMPMAGVMECLIKETKEPGNVQFDLAEPLRWATQHKKLYDNILIISDKKVVSSPPAFSDAVQQYRRDLNLPDTKVAVIGLSDYSSCVDRNDLNMLEVSGFNETVPPLIYNFFLGHFDYSKEPEAAAAP